MKYAFIRDQVAYNPLQVLCRALDVLRSGYHAWRTHKRSRRSQENARLTRALKSHS